MTPNKRDLKAYSRFDGTGRIVPGSTVLRRNKPKVGNWKETQAYECCVPPVCPEPLIMEVIPSEGFYEFGFRVYTPNSVRGTIDLGDGNTETFNLTNTVGYTYFGHNYSASDSTPQLIKVSFESTIGFRNLEIGDEAWKVVSVTDLSAVFAGSSIDQIDIDDSLLTSLNVNGLASLRQLFALNSSNLTYVNLQDCIDLETVELNDCNFQTIDFSGCTLLDTIDVFDNPNLNTLVIDSGCPNIQYIDASNAAITNVDDILIALDNNGLSGGFVDLSGGSSDTPGVPGLAAKANLVSNGWTVLNN